MITILSLFSNTAQDKRKNKNTVYPIHFKNTLKGEEDLGWLNTSCVITAAWRQTVPKPSSKANFFPRKVTTFQIKRRKSRHWEAAAFHTARWKKVFATTTWGHSGKANFILVRWGGHLCQWHLNFNPGSNRDCLLPVVLLGPGDRRNQELSHHLERVNKRDNRLCFQWLPDTE